MSTGPDSAVVADLVIFRGHWDPSWKLSSRLERNFVMYGRSQDGQVKVLWSPKERSLEWYDQYCAAILLRFRDLSTTLSGYSPTLSNEEVWALGRHHGLITPLLDWTESPYVAAYFAFTDLLKEFEHGSKVHAIASEKGAVRIWGLRFWERLVVPGEFELVRAIPPTAHRQRAQRGLFTRLRCVDHFDLESYLKARGLSHSLEAYDIPKAEAINALRDFELMNLTPATLFPDLDGAAAQANIDVDALRSSGFAHDYSAALKAQPNGT